MRNLKIKKQDGIHSRSIQGQEDVANKKSNRHINSVFAVFIA